MKIMISVMILAIVCGPAIANPGHTNPDGVPGTVWFDIDFQNNDVGNDREDVYSLEYGLGAAVSSRLTLHAYVRQNFHDYFTEGSSRAETTWYGLGVRARFYFRGGSRSD